MTHRLRWFLGTKLVPPFEENEMPSRDKDRWQTLMDNARSGTAKIGIMHDPDNSLGIDESEVIEISLPQNKPITLREKQSFRRYVVKAEFATIGKQRRARGRWRCTLECGHWQ